VSKPEREIELKLAVPGGSAGALAEQLASHGSPGQQGRRQHQVTTYFDTRDATLARSGMSLRVRCTDGRYVQTLKADRSDGAAANRAEWEWPVKANKPELGLVARTPLAEKLPLGIALHPVVTTDIDRTIRILELDGGTVVEAALDEGFIAAGTARAAVHELELELRTGDAAPLFRYALELLAAVPLTIESQSKAERGYRLRNRVRPEAHKAKDITLDPRATGADAFRKILTAELGHLLANQPAALAGDPEGIHQMRVAIRRLRAALALFEPHLEPHAMSRFQAELRRVGRVFGEARDWDVLCLQILPDAVKAAGAGAGCDLLRAPAMAEREAAHQRFGRELLAPPFTALVLGLAAWAEQGAGQRVLLGDPALDRPIHDLSPRLLDRLARKVRRRGRRSAHGSDTGRHALRKSLKKLRYGIEYLRSVFPGKPADSYVRDCDKLLKTLGGMNDAVTATALADGLRDGARADLVPAIGVLARQLRQRRNKARQKLAKRWKTYRSRRGLWA
jgi:triphosphatase